MHHLYRQARNLPDEWNGMKERKMLKRILAPAIFALFVNLGAVTVSAQATPSTTSNDTAKAATDLDIQMVRQDIRDHRKQVLAANMVLTADEATKFWPIYDQYTQEAIKINDSRWELIKSYAASYDTMSDDQASDFMKRSGAIEQQLMALRDKYVPIFEKAVPPKKTALWYQIDRRLDLVLDVQLASMIPVVDASK
jgi:hypothetical protein